MLWRRTPGREAGSAPQPWALWLSTRRLTSWTEELQAEQEEQLFKNQELQASLEDEEENLQRFKNSYRKMLVEQRAKAISLPKLSVQCKVSPGAGGPQDTGPEPCAHSRGLRQVT